MCDDIGALQYGTLSRGSPWYAGFSILAAGLTRCSVRNRFLIVNDNSWYRH